MQIIFVRQRVSALRMLTVSRWQLLVALVGLLAISLALGVMLGRSLPRFSGEPVVAVAEEQSEPPAPGRGLAETTIVDDTARIAARAHAQAAAHDLQMRENIDALAQKLGQMQAQLMRLGVVGERVAKEAGVKLGTQVAPRELPGQGGPFVPDAREMSFDELRASVDDVSLNIERRTEQMMLLETELLYRQASRKLVPTDQPVDIGFTASRYGRRIDPITGRRSFHEGVDFGAPPGTPIFAAGAGVVVFAGRNGAYGRQVDIDHGDGLMTRYAHARKLVVNAGDIVRQGQKIAEVGNSGRSTGPHLHFEVRVNGASVDPMSYLRRGGIERSRGRIARR
ncbi:MAG: M23 family metallopeptidase [Burkholderiaceae bacterium]|nr:M23 family metallopeptidase [Burkholderiaceae bacterium]